MAGSGSLMGPLPAKPGQSYVEVAFQLADVQRVSYYVVKRGTEFD